MLRDRLRRRNERAAERYLKSGSARARGAPPPPPPPASYARRPENTGVAEFWAIPAMPLCARGDRRTRPISMVLSSTGQSGHPDMAVGQCG